jgi:hypothetical protein
MRRLAALALPSPQERDQLEASAEPSDRAAGVLLLALQLLAEGHPFAALAELRRADTLLEQLLDLDGEDSPDALGQQCPICSAEHRHTAGCPLGARALGGTRR